MNAELLAFLRAGYIQVLEQPWEPRLMLFWCSEWPGKEVKFMRGKCPRSPDGTHKPVTVTTQSVHGEKKEQACTFCGKRTAMNEGNKKTESRKEIISCHSPSYWR